MLTLAVLSFFQIWLSVYAACGLAESDSVVKNTHWASGSVEDSEGNELFSVYLGITHIVVEDKTPGGETHGLSWDTACDPDENDADIALGAVEYCEDCKDATASLYTMVLLAALSKVGQMMTDIQRSTRAGDFNCQKILGIVTGIFSSLMNLLSFQAFLDACYQDEDITSDAGTASFSQGPGLIVMVLMSFLSIFDGIVHLLTPVPEAIVRMPGVGFPESRKRLGLTNKGPMPTSKDVEMGASTKAEITSLA